MLIVAGLKAMLKVGCESHKLTLNHIYVLAHQLVCPFFYLFNIVGFQI